MYRSRIGSFLPSNKIGRIKYEKINVKKSDNGIGLLLRIFLLMSVISSLEAGYNEDNIFSGGKLTTLRNCRAGGEIHLEWKQFITSSENQSCNSRAKMLHCNIKREISNMHVNISSVHNKMREVKNLIAREKPNILGSRIEEKSP